MPPLTIRTGTRSEPLLEAMARDLAAVRDPVARHWLVLPGPGMSTWLQRRWADRTGIAAHGQVVELRSLVEQAAAHGRTACFPERLVLAVAGVLPAFASHLPIPADRPITAVDARALSWAQRLAEAIDMGLLCRDGDARWGTGTFLHRLAEEPSVREALAGHLGWMDAEAIDRAVDHWCASWAQRPGGIPHLWLLLDAGLPMALMRGFAAILRRVPADRLHVAMLDPGEMFWGDLAVGRRRWQDQDDAGPLLRPFGRRAQDLHNQMIDAVLGEGSGGESVPVDEDGDTTSLLARLQESCRAAMAPAMVVPLAAGDRSVTVHACRSVLRELEVCRDRILQALDEDPTLAYEDILLLLADPAASASLVAAAFQPQAIDDPLADEALDPIDAAARTALARRVHLPFRLLGAGAGSASPFASCLRRLLAFLGGRCGLADVQALVEDPLVAERFDWDRALADGEDLVGWLADAGFRWGVDAAQRTQAQGDGDDRWHLGFALRRLGLGAVVARQDRDGIVDDAAPLDRAAGLGTSVLAGLARFARSVQEAQRLWAADAVQPVAEWCRRLTRLCEGFIAPGGRHDQEDRGTLLGTLLPALERAAPADLALRADAFVRLLLPRLDALTEGHGAGGGILVGDLRRLAGTPARLVLVAGLGAEGFPRREERPAWHPLADRRALGDPDKRDADRHALLLAVLSCSWRLVLTWQGGSETDAKERPPSTPLADLLASIDRVTAPPASAVVAFRHGLNGSSPAAWRSDVPDGARGRLGTDWLGATLLVQGDGAPYPGPWCWRRPALAGAQELPASALRTLFTEPCRLFLARLGVRLPEEPEELPAGDILEPDGLQRWQLRDRLLRCRITGGDETALRRRLEVAGDLPRGRYGEACWRDLVNDVPSPDGGLFTPVDRLGTGSILVDGVWWSMGGPASADWFRDGSGGLACLSASKAGVKQDLLLAAGLVITAWTGGPRTIRCWNADRPDVRILTLPADADPEALLTTLVRLNHLAACLPLPFWPQAFDRMRDADGDAARRAAQGFAAWQDDQGTVPAASGQPATRLCFRGCDDPFAWTPEDAPAWLPEPGVPLAVRVAACCDTWLRSAVEVAS